MNTAILLFAIFTNPDGTREASDIAVFAEREPCEVVATVMNESPRRPKNIQFACRVAQPVVKS
jgi:hypothetical protein